VRWIERRRRARIGALVPAFARALDLGSEDGALAASWASKGRFVLLLDLDPTMLRRAERPAVAADASALPVPRGTFDVVVLSAILEHVVDPARTLAEAARALRPGGTIVAYVPWDRAVVRLKRIARALRFPLGKLHGDLAPGHLRVFDRARLARLFEPVAREVSIRLDPWSLGYYVEAAVH
jgi:2-polyprenyl-6-hydroxyphenyl methylase/3-demethylubiquinone-9 3-methyltransferase